MACRKRNNRLRTRQRVGIALYIVYQSLMLTCCTSLYTSPLANACASVSLAPPPTPLCCYPRVHPFVPSFAFTYRTTFLSVLVKLGHSVCFYVHLFSLFPPYLDCSLTRGGLVSGVYLQLSLYTRAGERHSLAPRPLIRRICISSYIGYIIHSTSALVQEYRCIYHLNCAISSPSSVSRDHRAVRPSSDRFGFA